MRTTANDARVAFEKILLPAIGGRPAKGFNDVGAYRLDNNPDYGGFVVEQIISSNGNIIRPFGNIRMATKDFVDTCYFVQKAMDIKSKQEENN